MHPDERKKRKSQTRAQFRRNRQARAFGREQTAVPISASDWEEDETLARAERMLPAGEETRQKEGISHTEAISVAEDGADVAQLCDGWVTEIKGQWSQVWVGDEDLRCQLRGKLKELAVNQRSVLAVGDRVRVEKRPDGTGLIRRVLPRTNEIIRKSFAHDKSAHVISANVEQMVVVSSCGEPPLWPGLIDRYLVVAHSEAMSPLVCINKSDMGTGEAARCVEEYRGIGYDAFLTSTVSGDGLETLKERLKGKTSVFVGQSGVGKSCLLNVLEPGLNLRTGEVSRYTSKGRHITTSARLIRLSFGAFVVDTPGVRTFDPFSLYLGEVEQAFPEVVALAAQCRFQDCSHDQEPGCAVRKAVEEGTILERRYRSFRSIVE
jgi:ribosome biogenesis GTPase